MLKKMLFALSVITIFMAMPAFAAQSCKNVKFFGSYTQPLANFDVFGNGTVIHNYVNQLTLHEDGTANSYSTAYNDYLVNLGTNSPAIGSWTCRGDGKLVVVLTTALFIPSVPDGNAPNPDVTLYQHFRTTYLFAVEDENTIKRLQSRSRRYTPSQDPSDPNGGTLGTINNTESTYKRLIATDADLLAP